jgi:lysophospholipase L1-like esterase
VALTAVRPLVVRLLALSIGLAAGLVGMELAIRGFDRVRERGDLRGLHVTRPDQPWLYELRAGAELQLRETGAVRYRINEQGFRDRSRALPKPPDVFRILALGDSVTFGYGVEQDEAYPSQLEALLAERPSDARVEVLNLGVGGYNAYNEAALLAGRGRDYQPDLVLVQFCINDLNDPTLHFDRQTRLQLGRLPDAAFPNPAARMPLAAGPGLCPKLRLCALLHERVAGLAELRSSRASFESTFAPRDGRQHVAEWQWLRSRYREMARTASALGAAFVVVAFPFEAQLAEVARRDAQQQLEEMGSEEGWRTIDLLPAFRSEARVRRLLFDLWHPTPAGHRLAAQVIARELRREL